MDIEKKDSKDKGIFLQDLRLTAGTWWQTLVGIAMLFLALNWYDDIKNASYINQLNETTTLSRETLTQIQASQSDVRLMQLKLINIDDKIQELFNDKKKGSRYTAEMAEMDKNAINNKIKTIQEEIDEMIIKLVEVQNFFASEITRSERDFERAKVGERRVLEKHYNRIKQLEIDLNDFRKLLKLDEKKVQNMHYPGWDESIKQNIFGNPDARSEAQRAAEEYEKEKAERFNLIK